MPVIVGWILFSIAAGILADRRGRSAGGWFLIALLISPLIAVILVLCCRDLKAEEQQQARDRAFAEQTRAQQQQLQELRRIQTRSERPNSVLPPPGGHRKFRIAKNGVEIGTLSVPEIRTKLENGEISWDDYYWDTLAKSWIELTCLEDQIGS